MSVPFSILLIDDDTDDAILFEEILLDMDFNCSFQWARDGKEAIDVLEQMKIFPNVIFLDLNMPRINGKECLSYIKTSSALREIPVIIYTTSSHPMDIEETLQLGASAFITKPSDVKDLVKIIQAIVEGLPIELNKSITSLSMELKKYVVI